MTNQEHIKNIFGQPIGCPLPDWSPRALLARTVMVGQYTRREPLHALLHAHRLIEAFDASPDMRNWT